MDVEAVAPDEDAIVLELGQRGHPGDEPPRGRATRSRITAKLTTTTRNPWAAVDVATDPVAHARLLRRAHERTIVLGENTALVRDLVAASWKRCLDAGVAPGAPGAPLLLGEQELEQCRDRSPLAPAVDSILASLRSLDEEARHVVAIADADANLLWVVGEGSTVESAREMQFVEGAAWAELRAGTNAVGTAAALDHPVQIFSAEHLVEAVHPWTCAAAPIHDPVTGELIGVVDLTAKLATAHPHTLSLAAVAARAAEATLKLLELERSVRLRERWEAAIASRRGANVLLDGRGRVLASRGVEQPPVTVEPPAPASDALRSPDGRVWAAEELGGGVILWLRRGRTRRSSQLSLQLLGSRPRARFRGREECGLRSLELLAVLAMHPEGLSAEQLALALYGERGKTVTVRAQVHRLREHLGADVVSTQPYRLATSLDADWMRVQRLVSDGQPEAALKSYAGPLLRTSDAPAIRDARILLEESLRRSILTTADPKLLASWLAHPAGSDDLPAARALVAVLPGGDPRRAAATAAVASIARRIGLSG